MDFIATLEVYAPSPVFSSSGFSSSSVALPFINSRTQNCDPGRTYNCRYRTHTHRYVNGINNLCSPAFTGPQPLHVFDRPLSPGSSQQYRLEHGDEDEVWRDTVPIDDYTGFAENHHYYDDDEDDENPHSEHIEYTDGFIFVDNDLHNPSHPWYNRIYRIDRSVSSDPSSQDDESTLGVYGGSHDGNYSADDNYNYNGTDHDNYNSSGSNGDGNNDADDNDDDDPTVEHIEGIATLSSFELE
ncbi:hypothetical protein ASPSYDRAFT_85277 [Aspergillus sydowii CBS 593.65]|uniref:Uncharacterized protein n=1 Tax=Aspergillus sydowii CBS 593.65 TaxID=1036612 RepID=A0A1L9U0W5_9EURO|nr:uncharacterized protein ASPSYDRAFT_85277 [Aspergillus sydowii CBS 593.65]OJJ65305.1 hypothetical protein ASPSYDRAFT_85277 [Aspergillus sydowii CBS 593.65]